jgi:hypothetical protein
MLMPGNTKQYEDSGFTCKVQGRWWVRVNINTEFCNVFGCSDIALFILQKFFFFSDNIKIWNVVYVNVRFEGPKLQIIFHEEHNPVRFLGTMDKRSDCSTFIKPINNQRDDSKSKDVYASWREFPNARTL